MARAVPAVVHAMDVLELFLTEESLTAREIVDRLGLPRTTVHDLLNTLVEGRFLYRNQDRSLSLGLRLFQLGGVYAERFDLAQQGKVVAERVADRSQETVHVGILDGRDVVYVVKVDSVHSVRMVSAVGRRIPAHCTAVGKVLLSVLPPAEVRGRLSSSEPLPALTHNSITSLHELESVLETVRESGVAFEEQESNPDVACAGAPVYDQQRRVVAAMSVSVPVSRWANRTPSEWGELVVDGAMELSRELGYRP